MFFPFISGKNFAFRILVELLLVAYVILAIKDPKYRPKTSLLMWAALGFLGWMALATIFSVDPIKSFWSNFERMDGYITLIHLFVMFIITGAVLGAEKWWEKFFRVSIVASICMGIYGILQLMGVFAISSQSGPRIDTTFGNATYLAVFMLFNIFITIFMLVRDRKNVGLQVFYGIALVLQTIGLYYTETRGAILGLIAGLIVGAVYMAIFGKGEEWKNLRRISIGGLAIIVLLVGSFFLLKNTSFVKNSSGLSRLASISLEDRTTQSRFLIWNMALQGAKEKPLFGWGQENFNFVFNKYYTPEMYSQEQWFDRAHDEFLDWLVAGGIPAFLLYISLFGLAIWAIWKSEELTTPQQAALFGLLGAYGFNNIFVFDNLMSIVYFFLILGFIHTLSWKKLPSAMFLLKPANDRVVAIAAPIVAIVILMGGWFFNADGIARAQILLGALQSNNPTTGAEVTLDQRFATFKVALSGGELGRQETIEQLFQFASNSIVPSTSASPQLKQDVYAYTLQIGQGLLKARPNDARLELFMSVFLAQFGQTDQALAHLQTASSLSPDKQQILFQIGNLYLQKGDIQNAVATFKKAYDLEQSYASARILYAASLYYAGQNAQADQLLTDGFGTVLYDDEQLLQIYTNTKQFGRVVAIWEARFKKSPNDANVALGLASVYFQAGDISKTIETLKTVAKLNPTMAAQVQSIISQIQDGSLKPPTQ